MYGCDTSSLTLSEQIKLSVFENAVGRGFGPTKDEITAEWGEKHNEKLYDL
jgi:hypothetical protein